MIFDKLVQVGTHVMVALIGDQGIHDAIGGTVIDIDAETIVIETSDGLAVIVRSQVKAVFLAGDE